MATKPIAALAAIRSAYSLSSWVDVSAPDNLDPLIVEKRASLVAEAGIVVNDEAA